MTHSKSPWFHGVAGFVLWGLFPIYFKLVKEAGAIEILCHRIVWSALFLLVVLRVTGSMRAFYATLRSPRLRRFLAATTVLVAANWLMFIWAVNEDRAIEASLGYFISPLLSCLLGIGFLGERLTRLQGIAFGCALAGVLVPVIAQDSLPWIALFLGASFSLYGFLRKKAQADPVAGLAVETVVLMPVALAWLSWLHANDSMVFWNGGGSITVLLLFAGAITAIPLILFASAANHIPLNRLGLLQYITPSCQFLVALWVFGEPLSHMTLVSFGFIWVGLALYSAGNVVRARAKPQAYV